MKKLAFLASIHQSLGSGQQPKAFPNELVVAELERRAAGQWPNVPNDQYFLGTDKDFAKYNPGVWPKRETPRQRRSHSTSQGTR